MVINNVFSIHYYIIDFCAKVHVILESCKYYDKNVHKPNTSEISCLGIFLINNPNILCKNSSIPTNLTTFAFQF